MTSNETTAVADSSMSGSRTGPLTPGTTSIGGSSMTGPRSAAAVAPTICARISGAK
jgi:hypothetical protein